ncbi:NAD-dependent protein deacetylase [soil metagenome]|nr:NAD-dependent deacylase [Actinomycetota bacterium]MDQ3531917.1 NAD-dependent deacylase [Actinomycetota bacterium]
MKTETDEIAAVAEWLEQAGQVTALTGAGISTESGIPDFRGPNGLWTKDPAAQGRATIQHYMASREARVDAWRMRSEHPSRTVDPNAGHAALAELERKGRLHTLITQNIDSLHQRAGSSAGKIIEIHGTLRDVVCMSCGERGPMEAALERVGAGEDDPPCTACGGVLKSATISFGQPLVPEILERAQTAASACDVLLAIGTSLSVFPAAYLPQRALQAGARLVIVNAEPTRYDGRSHAVLRGPISRTLASLVALV